MKDSKRKKNEIDSCNELDWSQIINDSPDITIKDNNKNVNRGIKFENLIEKLLSAMFAGEVSWQRTQETNDGKKDFYRYINDDLKQQEWAECKNYTNNLSINILSPTMVMAALENIKTVYFFSRTPLNDNAVESVIRYSQTTGKKVCIIDGKLLEAYIVKFWGKPEIRKFFQSQADKFRTDLFINESPKLQTIKLIRDFQGNKLSSEKIFARGEKFNLCIILRNISTFELEYKISIKQSSKKVKFNNGFICNTFIETGHLEPGLIKELSYSCSALLSGTEQFTVQVETESNSQVLNYKIEISEDNYTLWTGSSALAIRDYCVDHLKSFNQTPIVICGAEGTGKSTLLTILTQEDEICSGYRIINVENNLSRNQIFQNILFKSIGAGNESVTPIEQIEEEAYLTSFMFDNYIQSDKQFAKSVMEVYSKDKPFLFTFDDADKISRNHRDIIRALIRESKSQNKKIYFIFTLNNDNGNGLELFLNNIGWADLYEKSAVNEVKLELFNPLDAINCLKLGYGLKDFEYAFENFDRPVSPMDIRNFIEELRSQKIICRLSDSHYAIVDRNKFEKAVQTSLYANRSFHQICYNLNDISKFVMKYIYTVEKMHREVQNNYTIAVSELLKIGLIKYEQDTVILANENFANSIKGYFEYTADDYADIYDNTNVDKSAKAICALNLISNKQKEKTEFLNNFFQSIDKNMRPSKRYEICCLICDKYNYMKELNMASVALNFVKSNLNYFNKEQGHDSIYALYEKIANVAINCDWDEADCIITTAELMKKVLDRALSTYHNKECYGFAMSFIDKIKISRNMNDTNKSYWLSHFFNRAAIACERDIKLSDFEVRYHYTIDDLYNISKEYCAAAGNPDELLLQMNVDEFNRHYVYNSDMSAEMVQQMQKEIYCLNADNIERKQCLDYHKILYDYLAVRFNVFNGKRSDIIEELYSRTDKILKKPNGKSPFYMSKLYLIKIYLLIENNQYLLADKTAEEALDYVYLNELKRVVYKFTFVRAQLADLIDKTSTGKEKKLNNSVLALRQFLDRRYDNEKNILREIYVAIELLSYIRKNTNDKFAKELLNFENKTQRGLWNFICGNKKESQFSKSSYFCFNGIQFPVI